MRLPWKSLVTVTAISAVGISAMAFGQTEIALVAAGALAGYLGKLNGSPS